MKQSQIALIRDRLTKHGYVTRNWCLQRYISRLSSIIFYLKAKGMKIDGDFIKTRNGKDYKYTLKA